MATAVLSFEDVFVRFDNNIGQAVMTYHPQDPDKVKLTRFIFVFGITLNILLDNTFEFLLGNKTNKGQKAQNRSFNTHGWVYGQLEQQLSSRLGLDGRQCLLRFICDLQSRPIQDWSLAGQVISVLFTPQYGDPDGLRDYREATLIGRQDARVCQPRYSGCGFSVFEYLEDIEDPEQEYVDDDDCLEDEDPKSCYDFYDNHDHAEND